MLYTLGLLWHGIKVYRWGFPYLDYSFNLLVLWSRELSLYSWFCLYSVLSVLSVWIIPHIWGFLCLDYSFDVLILGIGNLSLYNWFCHIHFTWCLIACSCVSVLMTWFSMHALWLRFIDTHMPVPACHLALIIPLIGLLLTTLDLYIQISKLELWWTSCWSELRSGSVVDQQLIVRGPILPSPLLVSQVFLL